MSLKVDFSTIYLSMARRNHRIFWLHPLFQHTIFQLYCIAERPCSFHKNIFLTHCTAQEWISHNKRTNVICPENLASKIKTGVKKNTMASKSFSKGKKVGNFKTMKNFKFFPWSSKNKPWKSFFDFDFYQDSQSTFVVATKQSLFNNVFLEAWMTLDLKLKRAILWLDNTMRWPIKNDLARNWNKPKKDRPDQRTWRDDIKRPTVKNLSVMDPSMNLRIVRQKKCKEKIEKKYHLLIQIWGVCAKKMIQQ